MYYFVRIKGQITWGTWMGRGDSHAEAAAECANSHRMTDPGRGEPIIFEVARSASPEELAKPVEVKLCRRWVVYQ